MAYLKVYSFNNNNEFVGETLAQESPLEPGIYLMPANTTTIKPPNVEPGYVSVFEKNNNNWFIKSKEVPVIETPPVNPNEKSLSTIELLQNKLMNLETENENLRDTVDDLILSML